MEASQFSDRSVFNSSPGSSGQVDASQFELFGRVEIKGFWLAAEMRMYGVQLRSTVIILISGVS